jgi:TRAP-type C4-dicarboxylate transport system substrate-binding protein
MKMKIMKNKLTPVLYLLLCFSLMAVITACGGSSGSAGNGATNESEATTEGDASSTEAETTVEPVIIKVAHNNSAMHHQHELVKVPFGEEVTEGTDGRVIFEYYVNSALGPANTQYDMVVNGIAGMTFTLQSYSEGKFPLTSVINLPLLADTPHEAAKIFYGLYDKFPEFAAEYSEVKLLWNTNNDPEVIFTRDKPITKMDDLKGMKIRTSSSVQNPVVEAWGATPINIPMPECYDAMQRGVIDGMIGPYSVIQNFKLADVTKYILDEPFFFNNFVVPLNLEIYNGLSEADRRVIDELAEKYGKISLDTYVQDGADGKQAAVDQGVELTQISPEEREKFRAAVVPTYENWVKQYAAKGLPAQEVFDEAVAIASEQ